MPKYTVKFSIWLTINKYVISHQYNAVKEIIKQMTVLRPMRESDLNVIYTHNGKDCPFFLKDPIEAEKMVLIVTPQRKLMRVRGRIQGIDPMVLDIEQITNYSDCAEAYTQEMIAQAEKAYLATRVGSDSDLPVRESYFLASRLVNGERLFLHHKNIVLNEGCFVAPSRKFTHATVNGENDCNPILLLDLEIDHANDPEEQASSKVICHLDLTERSDGDRTVMTSDAPLTEIIANL